MNDKTLKKFKDFVKDNYGYDIIMMDKPDTERFVKLFGLDFIGLKIDKHFEIPDGYEHCQYDNFTLGTKNYSFLEAKYPCKNGESVFLSNDLIMEAA